MVSRWADKRERERFACSGMEQESTKSSTAVLLTLDDIISDLALLERNGESVTDIYREGKRTKQEDLLACTHPPPQRLNFLLRIKITMPFLQCIVFEDIQQSVEESSLSKKAEDVLPSIAKEFRDHSPEELEKALAEEEERLHSQLSTLHNRAYESSSTFMQLIGWLREAQQTVAGVMDNSVQLMLGSVDEAIESMSGMTMVQQQQHAPL